MFDDKKFQDTNQETDSSNRLNLWNRIIENWGAFATVKLLKIYSFLYIFPINSHRWEWDIGFLELFLASLQVHI